MITYLFDARHIFLDLLVTKGVRRNSQTYSWVKWLSGWGIKSFALFVVF